MQQTCIFFVCFFIVFTFVLKSFLLSNLFLYSFIYVLISYFSINPLHYLPFISPTHVFVIQSVSQGHHLSHWLIHICLLIVHIKTRFKIQDFSFTHTDSKFFCTIRLSYILQTCASFHAGKSAAVCWPSRFRVAHLKTIMNISQLIHTNIKVT